jgi:hypothetical protein
VTLLARSVCELEEVSEAAEGETLVDPTDIARGVQSPTRSNGRLRRSVRSIRGEQCRLDLLSRTQDQRPIHEITEEE